MERKLYYIESFNVYKELLSLKIFTSIKDAFKYCKGNKIDISNIKTVVESKSILFGNDKTSGECKKFNINF